MKIGVLFCTSIALLLSCQLNTKTQSMKVSEWVDVTQEMLPPINQVEPQCEEPSLDVKRFKVPLQVPAEAVRLHLQGYAVFDYAVNSKGESESIVSLLSSNVIFKRAGEEFVKGLRYAVKDERKPQCASTKYRMGISYRVNSACTWNEFPRSIGNMVCASAEVKY